MTIVPNKIQETLRLVALSGKRLVAATQGGDPVRITQYAGILVFEDIPPGLDVFATVSRPYSLPETIDANAENADKPAQAFRFEQAERPPAVTVNGFEVRTTSPVIFNTPNTADRGKFNITRSVPDYQPLTPAQEGAVVPTGRRQYMFSTPAFAVGGAALNYADRYFTRFRWHEPDNVAAAQNILTIAAATDEIAAAAFATEHTNLVPGSIEITLPTSGDTLKDDGKGNLNGDGGSGLIDYQSGAFVIEANVAESGNVLANYEHGCAYYPLDLSISYDSQLQ